MQTMYHTAREDGHRGIACVYPRTRGADKNSESARGYVHVDSSNVRVTNAAVPRIDRRWENRPTSYVSTVDAWLSGTDVYILASVFTRLCPDFIREVELLDVIRGMISEGLGEIFDLPQLFVGEGEFDVLMRAEAVRQFGRELHPFGKKMYRGFTPGPNCPWRIAKSDISGHDEPPEFVRNIEHALRVNTYRMDVKGYRDALGDEFISGDGTYVT